MIYSVINFAADLSNVRENNKTTHRNGHGIPRYDATACTRPHMSATRLAASLIAIWKDIHSQMCVCDMTGFEIKFLIG